MGPVLSLPEPAHGSGAPLSAVQKPRPFCVRVLQAAARSMRIAATPRTMPSLARRLKSIGSSLRPASARAAAVPEAALVEGQQLLLDSPESPAQVVRQARALVWLPPRSRLHAG